MSWEQLGAIGQINAEELRREQESPPTSCPQCRGPIEPGRDAGSWHCPFDGAVFARGGVLILLP